MRILTLALVLLAALTLVGCSGESKSDATATEKPAPPPTTISFDHTVHTFGQVAEGEKVSHRFTFTNTGTNPLIIESVKPSCGCTTPEWSQEPIAPGASGFIVAEFDSKGRPGVNNKTITVLANTEPRAHDLRFTAEVLAAAPASAPAQKK